MSQEPAIGFAATPLMITQGSSVQRELLARLERRFVSPRSFATRNNATTLSRRVAKQRSELGRIRL